jgi:hypothetical protein
MCEKACAIHLTNEPCLFVSWEGYNLFVDGNNIDPRFKHFVTHEKHRLYEGFHSDGSTLTFQFSKPPPADEDDEVQNMRGASDAPSNQVGTVRAEFFEVYITGQGHTQQAPQHTHKAKTVQSVNPAKATDKKGLGAGLATQGGKSVVSSVSTKVSSGKYQKGEAICTLEINYYDMFRAQLRVDVAGKALIPIWAEPADSDNEDETGGGTNEARPATPPQPESPPKRRRCVKSEPAVVNLGDGGGVIDLTGDD